MTRPAYPPTRTVPARERRLDLDVADPYRWLERSSEEVASWQRDQACVAERHVSAWPHVDAVRSLLTRHWSSRLPMLPRFARGRWFKVVVPDGGRPPQLIVSDTVDGDGRVLLDLDKRSGGGPAPHLSWVSPSPDGALVAVGVCLDGSERNTIRIIDVDTAVEVEGAPPQVLHDGWTGGAVWRPDATGFWFVALDGPDDRFVQRPYYHRLGGPTTPEVDIPLPPGSRDYCLIQVSRNRRWAVALHGIMAPRPVGLLHLEDPQATWQAFLTRADGTVAGHVLGDCYVALTDIGAPRGRVVSIPLTSGDPDDPAGWTEVVPESPAVIRSITPVGATLYVTELVDTYSRVRIVAEGRPPREVPLPGRGGVAEPPFPMMTLVPRAHPDQFVFAFSTLTSSPGVYWHRPDDPEVETLVAPAVVLHDAVIGDHWATSADGTKVPYHTIARPQADEGPQPTMIWAYGGYNVALLPQYDASLATFVAAGGTGVVAHLRGGAELGRSWWEGGRMGAKANCYADLYAVAEHLLDSGVTTNDRLAVTGGSNGGLLAAVAVTQRPDLWAAAVPRVPLLDLLGALREPYTAFAVRAELADPDDPDDLRRLLTFSPYHLVRKGTRYPAVYVDAGDTDPRCPAWHARKWVALMQAAQAGDAPILLRVWENVGHGWATPGTAAITEATEWLAFVMAELGLHHGHTPGVR